jgi:hypothetical protein
MPGAGTMRAKQKRAGTLGQSSRFYPLTFGSTKVHIPGAQGFGQHNANVGSLLSLGIAKQTRKAGGNNVCVFNTKLHGARYQSSTDCACRGPSAGCPNCFNNKNKCTLTTK